MATMHQASDMMRTKCILGCPHFFAV